MTKHNVKKIWRKEQMYAMDVLKQAAKDKGIPLGHIGVSMGKARTYVNTTISKGTTPQADTLARMLDACGYGLYAMPKDKAPKDALQITPKDGE